MTQLSKTLIFPRGGKIAFVPHNSDGTVNTAGMVVNTGVIESIDFKVNINTSDLPDGNSDFPMGVYDTGREGTLGLKFSSYNPIVEALLIGADYEESKASTQMWSVDYEISVPLASPFDVTLPFTPTTNGAMTIVDVVSSPFIPVASSVASGKYIQNAAVLSFASADAGRPLFVTYDHTEDGVTEFAMKSIGRRPVYQAIIQGTAMDKDETREFDFNLIVDKVKAQGDVSAPVLQRSPQGWGPTLRVLKPRPGYAPVYKRFKEVI